MLHEKEKTFNWVTPKTLATGRNISEDFRVNIKHNSVYVGHKFMDQYYKGTDLNDVRVAFLGLENSDSPFLVINPNQGIPFFKFRANKGNSKHPSPTVSSKHLTGLLKTKFNAKDNEILSFKLVPFQRFNGMMFYSIVSNSL